MAHAPDLKALAAEFDATPQGGSWGEGHPIFEMAADVDRLTASLADSRRVAEQMAEALRGFLAEFGDKAANANVREARAALAAYDGADK